MMSLKHKATATVVAGALALATFGTASTALATPGKNKACSSCHKPSSAVKITLKKKSSTATKTTYTITISGGKGSAGWAVFSGTKNIKHGSSSTGTFSVARGKSYKVRAVKKRSGSAVRALSVN